MALVEGMGKCLIQQDNGMPCGRQIQPGEPIGTVIAGFAAGPIVGHKACADAYQARQNKEKQVVKIGRQGGPGGSIGDPSQYEDALAFGSVPLEKPDARVPDLASIPMPEGVRPLTDLPFEEPNPHPKGRVVPSVQEQLATTLSEEEAEIAEIRKRYAKARELPRPVHTVVVDISQAPENADIQITLKR